MSFATAQQSRSSWKEYVNQEEGFAVTVPESPTHHPDASTPEFMVYAIPMPNKIVLNLRVSNRKHDCGEFLDQLKHNLLAPNSGIDPATVKTLSIDGNPGLEYQWISPLHTNSDRYYCVEGKFYVFSASWAKHESQPASIEQVEKSFRLLNAKSNQ